jgi:hypothetical protein
MGGAPAPKRLSVITPGLVVSALAVIEPLSVWIGLRLASIEAGLTVYHQSRSLAPL